MHPDAVGNPIKLVVLKLGSAVSCNPRKGIAVKSLGPHAGVGHLHVAIPQL